MKKAWQDLRSWMRMVVNKYSFILLIMLCFSSCTKNQIDPFFVRIIELPESEKTLKLDTITEFEWDDVVICNPGVTQAELHTILPGLQKEEIDLKRIIAFRKKDVIVHMIVSSYNPEAPSKVEFFIESNHFVVLDHEQAVFNIIRHDGYIELNIQKNYSNETMRTKL